MGRPFWSWTLGLCWWAATWWTLGKYSTLIPSALRQSCPKFCSVMNLWTNSTVLPKRYLMLGSDSPFQDITQNPETHKHLHARNWWLLHYWPKIRVFPADLRHSKNLIWSFDYQLLRYVKHLFQREIVPCLFAMQIVWVILSHEYRCFHCRRHKRSPKKRLSMSCIASFE